MFGDCRWLRLELCERVSRANENQDKLKTLSRKEQGLAPDFSCLCLERRLNSQGDNHRQSSVMGRSTLYRPWRPMRDRLHGLRHALIRWSVLGPVNSKGLHVVCRGLQGTRPPGSRSWLRRFQADDFIESGFCGLMRLRLMG